MRALVVIVSALALGAACTGAHLEPHLAKRGSASGSALPSTSASASARDPDDSAKAFRWLNAMLGCFTGGAWMEAIGSTGEERTLATVGRCRILVSEPLGKKADDAVALAAVRAIDPGVVDALAQAIEKVAPPKRRAELVVFIRLFGDAAREALLARRAADAARKGMPLDETAVTASAALAKLYASKDNRARVVSLILAADHLESARGLDSKSKALTASPAFHVVFGVAKMDAWTPYALATAKAAGHPVTKEDDAIPALAMSFAERFEAISKDLQAGETKEACDGYARRLRTELSESKPKKK